MESSALIEQWKDALEKFLNIDEELPSYETKTGRVRKRKSLIGTLQGVHDSMTGIIDIAMAGSLCKKGEFHKLLNEYGLVLIDECHHSASETIANVLKELKNIFFGEKTKRNVSGKVIFRYCGVAADTTCSRLQLLRWI